MKEPKASRRRLLGMTGSTLLSSGIGRGERQRETRDRRDRAETLDSQLDIGAVYIPWIGTKWGKCVNHEPAVGQYEITDANVVDQQVVQMQKSGISTLLFNFGASERDFDRFRAFRRAERSNEIAIEAFWAIGRIFQRDYELAPYLEFVRDEMVPLSNYKTIDGRPVVNFWSPGYLVSSDVAKRRIEDEWGSYSGFFEHIRSELTVDGNEPLLVGGIGNWAVGGFPNAIAEFGKHFDVITSWTANPDPGSNPWDEHLPKVEETFQRCFWYAIENDMEFVPMVFPGFDDRPNDCWGHDRHVPRSPERFAELFRLAFEYRTVDRTYIASWNDWTEGHQIEPGTFSGQSYGTAYLDVVKEAATADLPAIRAQSFAPVTLDFNRTVEESEVNSSISSENSRDLAFRCSELELRDADGQSVATYDVGRPDSEPPFTEGVYGVARNDERSTRWLGGPTGRSRVYFERGLVEQAAELRIRGIPITDDISADVLVDGTHTDHLDFVRDGWQDYVAALQVTTPTTAEPTTSATTTTRATTADATSKTAQQQAMAAEPSTTTTTAVDTPGFGVLTGVGALTLGAGRYLAGESDD